MFGIGGGEIFFIILIALMLFGSDKIPDIARTLGKGMAQLKNATNDIKSEIQKSAEMNGLNDLTDLNPMKQLDLTSDITKEIDKAKENIEDMTGPIKRQM
ncbi:sec-independent protein translocase [Flavobacterium limnosediminis JC2902]|uniref:Sec-independent protein translocase n=1 Tax=Flavobacterium limnosediminis JC2902 TaxID=1341181 RepID=V6SRT9_9FLAO|nr:twin-arginine translocase TatA/TatE family subunit [Flavobacterium limnosediminis]ESU29423.1 sec-independent protein translocase [Flavobacterium limnosediminis JC2902]